MVRTHIDRFVILAVAGLTATACESTTELEPFNDFNAEAALADYRAVDEILGSKGWKGFQALGTSFGAVGSTSALAFGIGQSLEFAARQDDARVFAAELVDQLRLAGPPTQVAAAPIISAFHRGRTFAYDPVTDGYAVDPEREGAPDTGVRWIVYDTNEAGEPDWDEEIGYADLIDEGDGSVEDVVLRLVVVTDDLTVLDYRTSVDDTGNGGAAVTVDGYLQSEADRLDFDIDVAGSEQDEVSSIDISFEMRIDSRDFAINGSVVGTQGESETGAIDISVQHGAYSIRVDFEGSDTDVAGTFYLDGDVFATMAGDPDHPTFLGASGEELTLAEVAVLLRIVAVVADVFQLFEDLVEPVGHLVVLGVIL